MQRNLKKQFKKLKREKKKQKDKANQKNNRFWYACFCLKENLFIGVSYADVKSYAGRVRIGKEEWKLENSKWRSTEHIINFSDKKNGDLLCCPKCGGKVDFRLWYSSSKPDFVNDKEDRTKKLSDPQIPTSFV